MRFTLNLVQLLHQRSPPTVGVSQLIEFVDILFEVTERDFHRGGVARKRGA